MTSIPRQARDGIMRAWLAILSEKHPQYTWIATEPKSPEDESVTFADSRSTSGAVVPGVAVFRAA